MKPRTQPIRTLLDAAGLKSGSIDGKLIVSGLAYDSRSIQKGDLFFAIKGASVDGHAFLKDAAAKGAAAAVIEHDVPGAPLSTVTSPALFSSMSKIADRFFERPSDRVSVIGITGTNGKTTTTFLVEDIFSANGQPCGVMGTVNYRLKGETRDAPNTTPFSIDVQRFFAEAEEKGVPQIAMEVSSHALEQARVDDVRFKVAVFTNLTQDHLDYHKTMEAYFEAKAKLFRRPEKPVAVINIDDAYGKRLADSLPDALTFGFGDSARLRAHAINSDLNGLSFELIFPSGRRANVANNLLGKHNVSNCLAAAGAALSAGLNEEQVLRGLNSSHAVPGRLERVEAGQKFVIAIDYAHTPDALAQVLTTLRNTGPRRLFCVFGAGGDRDRTKRPKMGALAVTLADHAFVTSDNPRTEDPKKILADIEEGIRETGKKNYEVIEDRTTAIRKAVASAGEGDIILIAGKGHENYQIIGTTKHHFSDFEVAREAIQA